jgi:hypothetical protein
VVKHRVVFREDAASAQEWKLRVLRGEQGTLAYRLRSHLSSGKTIESDLLPAQERTIYAHDQIVDALDLLFFVGVDLDQFDGVFAEVLYEDRRNGYRREERVEIAPGQRRAAFHIGLLNGAKREYEYEFTFVGKDHSIVRRSGVTDETEMIIAP